MIDFRELFISQESVTTEPETLVDDDTTLPIEVTEETPNSEPVDSVYLDEETENKIDAVHKSAIIVSSLPEDEEEVSESIATELLNVLEIKDPEVSFRLTKYSSKSNREIVESVIASLEDATVELMGKVNSVMSDVCDNIATDSEFLQSLDFIRSYKDLLDAKAGAVVLSDGKIIDPIQTPFVELITVMNDDGMDTTNLELLRPVFVGILNMGNNNIREIMNYLCILLDNAIEQIKYSEGVKETVGGEVSNDPLVNKNIINERGPLNQALETINKAKQIFAYNDLGSKIKTAFIDGF